MRPGQPGVALAAVIVFGLFVSACSPRVMAPRIDDSDFVFPELRRGELTPREEKALRSAWDDILHGDVGRAEPALRRLLVARDQPPFRTVLGFAALRAEQLQEADEIFAAVLAVRPNDVAALLGEASVRRKRGLLDEALPLYLKAERLRPKDAALSRRASEVKLSVAEKAIARAGSLSAEGRNGEAMDMLQRALEVAPELSPVRLELADLLVEAGQRPEALAVLAAASEPDRNITIRMATIRFEDGDLDGAEAVLRRGPKDVAEDPEGAALLARISERRVFMALPEPLRAIGEAPRVTRAELAALVVVRVEALGARKPSGVTDVASDLSRTWARAEVLRALELGLMDLYPNHTFQPSAVIRRGELAVVAARVLDLVGWGRPNGVAPKDMSPSHLQYAAVLRVVGAGVMQNAASGAFEPWRIVSGSEVKAVIEALARLPAPR